MLDSVWSLTDADQVLTASQMMAVAGRGWVYVTAFVRLFGLLLCCPLFGRQGVSLWMRLVIAGCLAMIVTPLLAGRGMTSFPLTSWAILVQLGGEFVIGALLGCGVLFVFAGLKLAGELIDQQAGTTVQEVFDPQGAGSVTVTGQFLTLVGTLALLSMSPGNGHLLILGSLLDSFQSLPTPLLSLESGLILTVCAFGQSSLSLGLQMAAPVLAAGAIVTWGVSMLGNGPQASLSGTTLLGLPLRVIMSLGILLMCLSGMMEALLVAFDDLLIQFPRLLKGA